MYFASRLYNPTVLPVFLDEAVQVNWALNVDRKARVLASGKPLQVWLAACLLPWVHDQLLAVRCLSVLAGAVGVWATYDVTRRLHDRVAGRLAAALAVLCPFVFFHDRLALADVFLSSCSMLARSGSLALVNRPTLRAAVALTLALVLSVFAKVTGVLALIFPVLAWTLAPNRARGAWGHALLVPLAAAAATALPIRFFLRHTIEIQAKSVLAAPEDLGSMIVENLTDITSVLDAYWTRPMLVAFAVSLVLGILVPSRRRPTLLLLSACLLPLLVVAFGARLWYPRYLLPATLPALAVVGCGLRVAVGWIRDPRRRRPSLIAIVALISLPSLQFDLALATDPSQAPLPSVDYEQYVSGWPSGYGSLEAARYIRDVSREATGGTFILSNARASDPTPVRALRLYLRHETVSFSDVDFEQLRACGPGLGRDSASSFALAVPPHAVADLQSLGDRCSAVRAFDKPGGRLALALCRLQPC